MESERTHHRPRRRAPTSLTLGAIAVAVVSVGPLGYLVDRSLSQGAEAVQRELFQARTVSLILRSAQLVFMVTLLSTLLGAAAALLVARTDLPFRRIWRVAFALPLAIPTYVAAFTWLAARPSIPPFGGAVLVLVLCCYPYVYLPVLGALQQLDPAVEDAARSLGRRPSQVVLFVVLPSLRNAIASGALLVALYVLSDFGAVGTMRYQVFTWVIYGAYSAGFNPASAAILSLVLIAASVGVVGAEHAARGPAARRSGSGVPRTSPTYGLGRWRYPAVGLVVVVLALSLAFPVGSLMRRLVDGGRAIDGDEVLRALLASLGLSTAAALATTALALPIGLLVARHRSRLSVALERSTFVVHALPGIVIGISMVYVGTRLLRPVYQRSPLLVLAYAVISLPLAVASIHAAVEQVPTLLDDVARSLGRRAIVAFFAVTARVALPGIAAGAALVFLATMKELPATLLLHPTGTETLALRVWQRTSVSDWGGAAPFASVLVAFSAIATLFLGRWITPASGASAQLGLRRGGRR